MPGISLKAKRRGSALIITFIIMISIISLALGLLTMTRAEIKSATAGLHNLQAYYIAEAGLAKARWALTEDGQSLGWGESDASFGEGTYTVTTTDNGDGTCTIVSEGYTPDDTNPKARRRVEERDVLVSSGGGSNLSIGATATASAVQGSFVAANSNDGDSGTKWKSSVNNGSWLKLNFGSSTTFDRIVIDDGTKIDSETIEYSTDDVGYSAVTGLAEAPTWTFTFDPVSAQYLRLNVNGNRPEVNELETYDTSTGSTTLGQGDFLTAW